jgi:hypothetical protein
MRAYDELMVPIEFLLFLELFLAFLLQLLLNYVG